MLEKIAICIVVNIGLFELYWNVLRGYNYMEFKPFNCAGCITFWLGLLAVGISFMPYVSIFFIPLFVKFINDKL